MAKRKGGKRLVVEVSAECFEELEHRLRAASLGAFLVTVDGEDRIQLDGIALAIEVGD